MRSDEFYEDLGPLMNKLLEDDSKFVFGNIFAKPWSHSPHHIGDHLFAAETCLLRKAYTILYDLYTGSGKENLLQNPWAVQGFPSHQTAESVLSISTLKAKNIDKDSWYNRDVFLKNYDIVDINSLGEYRARWAHANTIYTPSNNPFIWPTKTMEDF